MTVNDSKFYLGYLNNLVDEYNNNYNYYIDKNPVHAYYSALTEECEANHIAHKFKPGDRNTIAKYKDIFSTSYAKN